jgi:hypothetical protein
MNPLFLAKAIDGIPGSKSVLEFQSRCKIPGFTTTIELLNFLVSKGIGKRSKSSLIFSEIDKLSLLLFLLQNGCDSKILSSRLGWKDFELFTSIILKRSNYFCQTNVRLRRPRFQIDVVGRAGKTALFVDCKHWKNISTSKRIECAHQQQKRARAYMKIYRNIEIGVPIIVTLNESARRFVDRVPFVAINRLHMFLRDYDLYHDEICCIR